MKLTKERAHKLCRAMWLEIARRGLDDKIYSRVLNWYVDKYSGVSSDCFACEFYLYNGRLKSDDCPPNILNGHCRYSCVGSGPYSTWLDDVNPKHAREIAELFRLKGAK